LFINLRVNIRVSDQKCIVSCRFVDRSSSEVDVVILKIFSQKKIGEKIVDFDSNYCYLGRKNYRNIEKTPFLSKIGKNRRKL
jgi:hypothetical protein